MKKWYFFIGVLVLLLIGFGWLNGLRLDEKNAIRSALPIPEEVRIVSSQPTVNGKAVLYEERDSSRFGVALLKRQFMIFWRYNGGSYGEYLQEGQPFKATGFAKNEKGKEQFAIGVKTESPIQYIAIGNDIPNDPSTPYHLTLDEVQKRPDIYKVTATADSYALFITDRNSEENWTIRAFDGAGKLVADKLFGSQPRYIKWE